MVEPLSAWGNKPWHPIIDPVAIKTLGKLMEELGELQAVLSRCLIQGVDEVEPVTGKPNRQWLREEIADVVANIELVVDLLGLPIDRVRSEEKKAKLRTWHAEA